MRRSCGHCGKPFEAKRSDAKFCGSTCRSLASVKRKREPAAAMPESASAPSSLVSVTKRDLADVSRLDTPLGQQAVELARRMSSRFESGSAVAALSKQLVAVMDEAMRGAHVKADPVDELRGRRERRHAG